MSLPAVNGNTIQAADLYQLCRPSGGSETGKYYLQGGGNAAGWVVSNYIPSLSRAATPVSVSIDTADQAPAANAGTPAAAQLTASGFQVSFACTAASNTARAGGNYTISY
jgi:hypothetical protein